MMTECKCRTGCNCALIAVITSVIIGVITAFLTYSSTIAVGTTFIWVVFAVALFFLAVLLVVSALTAVGRCSCTLLKQLLTGIIGTVLISFVLITVDIAAASILGAAVTGASLAFFSLIVTSAVCFVRELFKCSD